MNAFKPLAPYGALQYLPLTTKVGGESSKISNDKQKPALPSAK